MSPNSLQTFQSVFWVLALECTRLSNISSSSPKRHSVSATCCMTLFDGKQRCVIAFLRRYKFWFKLFEMSDVDIRDSEVLFSCNNCATLRLFEAGFQPILMLLENLFCNRAEYVRSFESTLLFNAMTCNCNIYRKQLLFILEQTAHHLAIRHPQRVSFCSHSALHQANLKTFLPW